MQINAQHSRRLVDKLLTSDNRRERFQSLSSQQQEELRRVCNLYKIVASQYLNENRLIATMEVIIPFLMFLSNMGKQILAVSEEDIIAYLQWLQKKNIPQTELSAAMMCIIDFFLVLLQEGMIRYNPLYKLYHLLLAAEEPAVDPTQPVLHQWAAEKPNSSKKTTAVAPSTRSSGSSQHLSDDDHDTYTIKERRNRSFPILLVMAIMVALSYVYFNFNDSLLWHTAQTKSEPLQENPTEKPTQNNKKIDRKVAYFYANNMKDYYCRDYLKVPCQSTTLLLNTVSPDAESMYEGRAIYVKQCLRCHGEMGRGDGPDAITLHFPLEKLGWAGNKLLERDAYLFWILAEGGNGFGGAMPAFKNILERDQIWKVILFLQTLG